MDQAMRTRVLNAIPDSALDTEEARAERKQKEAEAARKGIAAEFAIQAGGARTAGYRFKEYRANSDYQRQVAAAVEEWATTFPERAAAPNPLVLFGTCGTGKDHLIFAAANQVIHQNNVTAAWRNGRDLMGEVRDRISEDRSESQFFNALEAPQILVISDPLPVIGNLSAHQADVLYRIIDGRYAAKKLTLMTLNVTGDADADSRLGVATWDRICHDAWKFECKWPSYRQPAKVLTAQVKKA